MKSGTRALGIAVSSTDGASADAETEASDGVEIGTATATVAGAVVRVDRAVDGLAFSTCSIGGTDATAAVIDCFDRLDREDVRHLLIAGVAPAWFNVVDLAAVRAATDRPVVAVSFEASDGLAPTLREQFSGGALARRLATYESLPERVPVRLDSDGDDPTAVAPDLWVRAVGVDGERARRLVRAHTPAGRRRPEPLRVARVAARAGRSYLDSPDPPDRE
ncbi:DUF99 family protein [Halobaculum sp. CBA1158]|uniref:endonuclease dU n=1 Tax=Halobaculum sp. CBA1158 TaxID=2904243 RepID=UPI001F401464|nr:DUF99 family protein [Halobaculum sp. CBA1158]UIP00668.1 DUF99 family protein [Halobaculum sp. CBA1158]